MKRSFYRRQFRRSLALLAALALTGISARGLAADAGGDCPGYFAGLRNRLQENPWHTLRQVGVDTALYVPRQGIAFVSDTGQMFGKFIDDMVAAQGLGKLRRLVVMPRANPGQTSALDFIRDPITGILQPAAVRNGLGRLLGREIAPPAWTFAEPVTLTGGYFLWNYGADLVSQLTDQLNRLILNHQRKQQPIGFTTFDLWYHAGAFPSHTAALRFYQAFRAGITDWVQGNPAILPDHLAYLDHGYFGVLSAEELAHVHGFLGSLPNFANLADLKTGISQLSAHEAEVLQNLLGFEDSLRQAYFHAVVAHRKMLADLKSGKLAAKDFLPFDIFVQKSLAAAQFGGSGKYTDDQRELLAEALQPHVLIEGKSDLEWRLAAESAAANSAADPEPLKEAAALAAAWQNFQDAEASHAQDRKSDGRDQNSLWFVEATRWIVAGQHTFADPKQAGSKIAAAQGIPSFCEKPDCSDQLATLSRTDLPGYESPLPYFDGTSEKPLASEIDYWRLMFQDPRFIYFASEKKSGHPGDAAILAEFRKRLLAEDQLNRLQAQAFAAADRGQKPPAKSWREDEAVDIPKPAMATFCGLLGYGAKLAPANPVFQGMRTELDRLHTQLGRGKWNSCRAFVAALVWDYHALEGQAVAKLPAHPSAEELNRARFEMQDRIGAGEAAFREAIQACVAGQVPEPENPKLRAALDCEGTTAEK